MWHYGEGRKQDGDKALLLYSQAASLGDPPALNALGLIYSDPSNEVFDITQSREFYKRAYEQGDYFAPLNLARSYNYYVNYGKTSKKMNLYPENIEADILEARHWYSKALEIENYEGIYEYAETFDNEGDFESAKNILLQGLEIADANDPPDIVMKTHLLSFLSGYYHVQGYGEEALRVMKLAVDAVDREDVFEPVQAAMTYRDYGATLNNSGFKDEALIYYKKSEALLREAEEFELLAPTLNGKAVVLEDLELYEEAVKNYHLAFKAIEGFEGDIDLTLGMIHSNIVNALVQLDRLDEALFHARKAVEILAVVNKGHPWHISVLADLAGVYEKLKNFDAAQSSYLLATELFTNRYFSMSASDLDLFRYSEYSNSLRSINSAAEFLFRRYKRTNDLNHLDQAFVNYQKTRITMAEFEMARLSNRLNTYSDEISDKLRQYQVLSDQIDELKWLDLEETLFEIKDQNTDKTLSNDISELEAKRANLNARINSVSEREVSVLNDRFLTFKNVQDKLSDEQLLIFPAETFLDVPITVFLISNKKIATVRTKMFAADLRDAGLQLRSALQFNGSSNLTNLPEFDLDLSHQIYKELFSDVLDDFKVATDLIFIPSWPISNLPMAVLLSEDPAKTNYTYDEQSWLGLEKNISYLPSVSDLKMIEKSNSSDLFASFIGFGDPKLGKKTNDLRGVKLVDLEDDALSKSFHLERLPSLPSTAVELQAIKKIFPRDRSKIFMQEHATEGNLKTVELSEYNVLLFATHGVIADEWEFLDEPALVMTPPANESSTENDGLLKASEIRKLNLNADLVVLSACNTAAGDNQGAEGLSGLVSAFIFAGAKSIMASHWSVESNSTKLLITNFFENLKNSEVMTRSEAMRLSMEKLFSNQEYKHPIFWAPFVLVGQS